MFCDSSTKFTDLEIFILRACLNPSKKLFVIGNYQNLSVTTQYKGYKTILKYYDIYREKHPPEDDFPLYTLFYKYESKEEFIIEPLRRSEKL
jgi:hypothetical protein